MKRLLAIILLLCLFLLVLAGCMNRERTLFADDQLTVTRKGHHITITVDNADKEYHFTVNRTRTHFQDDDATSRVMVDDDHITVKSVVNGLAITEKQAGKTVTIRFR